MKKIFLLALLVPTLSFAHFNGRYSGEGSSYSHKSGNKRRCSEIFLHVEKTPSTLEFHHGGYKCENLQATLDPFTLEIRDGKIFFEGSELGTFANDRMEMLYANVEQDYTYRWVLEMQGEEMVYLEEWTSQGSPALTVSGRLKLLPNHSD